MTLRKVVKHVRHAPRKGAVRLVLTATAVALIAVSAPTASSADVTAVEGRAFGASGSVSLFGGPPIVFNPQPTVTLPAAGGNVSNSQPSIVFQAGPAQVLTTGPANVSS